MEYLISAIHIPTIFIWCLYMDMSHFHYTFCILFNWWDSKVVIVRATQGWNLIVQQVFGADGDNIWKGGQKDLRSVHFDLKSIQKANRGIHKCVKLSAFILSCFENWFWKKGFLYWSEITNLVCGWDKKETPNSSRFWSTNLHKMWYVSTLTRVCPQLLQYLHCHLQGHVWYCPWSHSETWHGWSPAFCALSEPKDRQADTQTSKGVRR